MNNFEEAGPRYRKKAQHHAPKKIHHRHTYKPCVLEYEREEFDKRLGWVPVKTERIKDYCTICGKVARADAGRWWVEEEKVEGSLRFLSRRPSEEAEREFNPATRTLPTFWGDDGVFTKYVSLEVDDGE